MKRSVCYMYYMFMHTRILSSYTIIPGFTPPALPPFSHIPLPQLFVYPVYPYAPLALCLAGRPPPYTYPLSAYLRIRSPAHPHPPHPRSTPRSKTPIPLQPKGQINVSFAVAHLSYLQTATFDPNRARNLSTAGQTILAAAMGGGGGALEQKTHAPPRAAVARATIGAVGAFGGHAAYPAPQPVTHAPPRAAVARATIGAVGAFGGHAGGHAAYPQPVGMAAPSAPIATAGYPQAGGQVYGGAAPVAAAPVQYGGAPVAAVGYGGQQPVAAVAYVGQQPVAAAAVVAPMGFQQQPQYGAAPMVAQAAVAQVASAQVYVIM